jgi:hypothetical protein
VVGVDVADVSAHGNARHDDERVAVQDYASERLKVVELLVYEMLHNRTRAGKIPVALLAMLLLMMATPASAHNGPPFPIVENRKVGPCIVALWTHPDVGTGAFYVFVEPAPGESVPDDLKIKIGVQPVTGRLPEKFYEAERVKSHGQVQYNAQADFDRQELWRVHLVIKSSQGGGEATAQVEVTPPGFGRWDLLLYLLPFLLVALLWLRGISRTRRRRSEQLKKMNSVTTAAQPGNMDRAH